jgi:hypothetical protein
VNVEAALCRALQDYLIALGKHLDPTGETSFYLPCADGSIVEVDPQALYAAAKRCGVQIPGTEPPVPEAGHPKDAVLRCKMRIVSNGRILDADGCLMQKRVTLETVGANNDENRQWAERNPCATVDIYIGAPYGFDALCDGHEFYVDFIPAKERS